MKKMALGKIIETTVDKKYKNHNNKLMKDKQENVTDDNSSSSNVKKIFLGDYYKLFDNNQVGRHTTHNIVGPRDFSKIDKLIRKY